MTYTQPCVVRDAVVHDPRLQGKLWGAVAFAAHPGIASPDALALRAASKHLSGDRCTSSESAERQATPSRRYRLGD
jgi:hypothetical protein